MKPHLRILKAVQFAPQRREEWDKKLSEWKQLYSDEDAVFDIEININAGDIEPMITTGPNPGLGIGITGTIPVTTGSPDEGERKNIIKSLAIHGA